MADGCATFALRAFPDQRFFRRVLRNSHLVNGMLFFFLVSQQDNHSCLFPIWCQFCKRIHDILPSSYTFYVSLVTYCVRGGALLYSDYMKYLGKKLSTIFRLHEVLRGEKLCTIFLLLCFKKIIHYIPINMKFFGGKIMHYIPAIML